MNSTASFWDFSVGTYRRPGVADACLSLQDRYGLDVNVLLLLLLVRLHARVSDRGGARRGAGLFAAVGGSGGASAAVREKVDEVRRLPAR